MRGRKPVSEPSMGLPSFRLPMARKNKSENKRKSATPPAWMPDMQRLRDAGTTAATLLIMGGLIAGLTFGRGPLQSKAAQIRAKNEPPLRVVFHWPTVKSAEGGGDMRPGQSATWLDPITRAGLEQIALSLVSSDPFDAASLGRAQAALMETGWFAKPCTVRRDRDAVVHVEGLWRVPYAVVRTLEGDRWVTFKGEALGKVFQDGTSGLCAIVGVSSPPPAKPGEPWPGGDVQAAISLLQYVRTSPGFDQIVGIDASDYLKKNKKQLAILTRYGSRIVWGGPVEQPLPGEWPSQTKLKQLAENVTRTGRIDAQRQAIDIRGLGGLTFVEGEATRHTPAHANTGKPAQ